MMMFESHQQHNIYSGHRQQRCQLVVRPHWATLSICVMLILLTRDGSAGSKFCSAKIKFEHYDHNPGLGTLH